MKRLVVARHGNYDHRSRLDQEGRRQMTELGNKLRGELDGLGQIKILSSTAPRAQDSAEVLAPILGVGFEKHEVLWSDGAHCYDLAAALALVQAQTDADVVVLVTHLEYTEFFPTYFGDRVLGVPFYTDEISKGTAWIIDCEQKSIKHLR